jgi:hypothetical protein
MARAKIRKIVLNLIIDLLSLIEVLTVSSKTLKLFVERVRQLYEQESGKTATSPQLGVYVKSWIRWTRAGLYSESAKRNALKRSTTIKYITFQSLYDIGSSLYTLIRSKYASI